MVGGTILDIMTISTKVTEEDLMLLVLAHDTVVTGLDTDEASVYCGR